MRKLVCWCAFIVGTCAWLSAFPGCTLDVSGAPAAVVQPDAHVCAPDAHLARCADFCIYEESQWQCDDNGRCVCMYERDHARIVLDCIGTNPPDAPPLDCYRGPASDPCLPGWCYVGGVCQQQ